MLNRNLSHSRTFLFKCAFFRIIFFCILHRHECIQLFYSIETKEKNLEYSTDLEKVGVIATGIPKLTSLFLFLPPQSYQTSVATKCSLAFVKTFISRANERATSSRTATKPGSFQKRNGGNTRAEFESVALHTYNHRAPGTYLPRQTAP